MKDNYTFIKAYQSDNAYRKSFNELAQTVFDINFESWYQNGYWTEKYIPYSFLHNDKVIANVSVSPMKFVHNGIVKNYVQLGTVMTEEAYRNQGLIRRLIHEVDSDYSNKVDGFFLFANETVLDFYPKFGYERVKEHSFYQHTDIDCEMTARRVPMKTREDFKLLEAAVNNSCIQSSFWMIENMELVMFYATNFMNENVFEMKDQNAYAIAELDQGELFLHQVFSPEKVNLERIVASFGKEVKKVTLGFTPLEETGFQWEESRDEDTVLYGKGSSLVDMVQWKQRISTLSHT
jgi:GNAT superfamily N-acetyltransferase